MLRLICFFLIERLQLGWLADNEFITVYYSWTKLGLHYTEIYNIKLCPHWGL